MAYYPTLDEDITRAKEIIDRGKMTDFEREALKTLPEAERQKVIDNHGSIYGSDTHAAYMLLKSFVAEIERLQALVPAKKAEPSKP